MSNMFYITDNSNDQLKDVYDNVETIAGLNVAYNSSMKLINSQDKICLYFSQAEKLGIVDASAIDLIVTSFFEKSNFDYTLISNKYVFVFIDLNTKIVTAYTDLFKNINIYYKDDETVTMSDSLSQIYKYHNDLSISKESIYHYLNFCYIPSPCTIYNGVNKLGAAQQLIIDLNNNSRKIERYWDIEYKPVQTGSETDLIKKIEDEVVKSVLKCNVSNHKNSSFLSGGTDSTSITSILSKNTDSVFNSYSIGFYEEEYSELEFVDIAQSVLQHNATKYKLSADEVYDLIAKLSSEFEEPFGNSSVLATYYCAKLSSGDNNDVMVAGDGGDEIFGGNERYAKDVYFQKYHDLPGVVKFPIEAIASIYPGTSSRFVNRVRNFIKRSNTKNPERFFLDDSFSSDYFDEMFTSSFKQEINPNSSLEIVKKNYDFCKSDEELDRLMQLDQLMAIAENDLSKVNTSADVNDIDVLYPFLDRELVEFMATIPKGLKVNGVDKRYGFKKAVANYTPAEILNKKKQGFGVPLSLWFKDNPKYIELIKEIFNSPEFSSRDIFNPQFCLGLLDKHIKGEWDYSQEIWIIINLELWLRNHS